MFPPRIFSLSCGLSSVPRILPTPAVMDDVAAEHDPIHAEPRRPPYPRMPSSMALPLVSRKTFGAWRSGLDRPLPIASAAEVGADEHGLGVATGQLCEVAAVGDTRLVLNEVVGMAAW